MVAINKVYMSPTPLLIKYILISRFTFLGSMHTCPLSTCDKRNRLPTVDFFRDPPPPVVPVTRNVFKGGGRLYMKFRRWGKCVSYLRKRYSTASFPLLLLPGSLRDSILLTFSRLPFISISRQLSRFPITITVVRPVSTTLHLR